MGRYHALMGAFDATADQKVFGEATFADLPNVIPVDLSGVKKKSFMTLLKIIMFKKLLAIPNDIKGMNNQFLKYRLPDDKLTQDIVSGFFVYAGLVWHMGLDEEITGVPREAAGPPEAYDRHARTRGVNDHHARDNARKR